MKKVVARSAAELCSKFELTPAGRALLGDAMSPEQFLDALVAGGLYADAIAFLTRALPKREAVWWACTCARETTMPEPPERVDAALQAAEAWVYKPNEERRREAQGAAEAAGFDSPESWAAVAAFWSGGSITPPDAPAVAPADDMTAKAVAGAVMLAAVRREPERADERYRLFIEKGRDIADGGTGREPRPPGQKESNR